jgi:uncharacterized membrane protein
MKVSSKTIKQLIALNLTIALVNIVIFSDALLAWDLFTGSALSVSIAWMIVLCSAFVFFKGNSKILEQKKSSSSLPGIRSLDDCTPALRKALQRGKVFEKNILKNIEQIKRYKRKRDTINDILLQKFCADEMSFRKFSDVLGKVEEAICINVRSILNKISAFDIDEYEAMLCQKTQCTTHMVSQEKKDIYNEFINFVNNATGANEDILLKLDKMLLEISRYNSLEDGDIQKLPGIIEMDELILNANLYK